MNIVERVSITNCTIYSLASRLSSGSDIMKCLIGNEGELEMKRRREMGNLREEKFRREMKELGNDYYEIFCDCLVECEKENINN